jgi:hypothetical protein
MSITVALVKTRDSDADDPANAGTATAASTKRETTVLIQDVSCRFDFGFALAFNGGTCRRGKVKAT